MEPEEVPNNLLSPHGKATAIKFKNNEQQNKFSLT